MITFILESDENGHVLHDFSFHLMHAIRYHDWMYGEKTYSFVLSNESIPEADMIPVGSLEFVMSHLQRPERVIPLNVPEVLNLHSFTKRDYHKFISKKKLKTKRLPLFVKESLVYKGTAAAITTVTQIEELPDVLFDVSEQKSIHSEWRIFVQQGIAVGAKPYLSEDILPISSDMDVVEAMIAVIESSRLKGDTFPLSYTLDIGVYEDETFLIEAHPFVSCGLYGFFNYQRLPSMIIQGYRYFQQQSGER